MGHKRRRLVEIATQAVLFERRRVKQFPWRERPTAYMTLVAEFFLQRTGAEQAVKPYRNFISTFSSFDELRNASDTRLLQALAPLGLRHRARTFVRMVRTLDERHGGRVPEDEAALLALPGVGLYTARAVLTFAYSKRVGIVDVNTARVLSRAVSSRRDAPPRPGQKPRLWALADELIEASSDARLTNWGLLDIGREVCKDKPNCSKCPLVHTCAYHARKRKR